MKTNLFKIVFLLVWVFQTVYSMGQIAYMHIEDNDFTPQKNVQSITVKNAPFQMFLNKYHFVRFNQAFPTAKSSWLQDSYIVEMKSEVELDRFIEDVSTYFGKEITLIEKLCSPMLTTDAFYPNDSLYVAGELSHLDYVRAPEAWNIAMNYGKIKVGITDTYFHVQHPDLHFDSITSSNIYYNNDHGTVVSGFISGLTNNNIGIASTGGFNTILIADTRLYEDSVVLSLAQLGCKVINCSWINRCLYSQHQDSLYHEILHTHDCLVVFGAGNGANHCSSLSREVYPASYPSCLSVTSIGHKYNYGSGGHHNWKDVHSLDVNDTTTSFHHNTAVDLCAPGYEVRSTNYWKGVAGYNDTTKSGTSFSAPIVTGIAAMVRAVNPYLTAVETMNILKETADASIYNIPENAPFIGRLGAGKVDAYAAVMAAKYKYVQNITYASGTNQVLSFYEIYAGYSVTDNKPYGNVVLQPGSNVTFRAKDKIELHPGFCVQQGATFVAQVDSLMLP